jgi:hypothetical protein
MIPAHAGAAKSIKNVAANNAAPHSKRQPGKYECLSLYIIRRITK